MIPIRYIFSEPLGWLLCLIFKPKYLNNSILSIYFHNPSNQLFEKCIKYISNKGYRFISIEELLKILNEKTAITEKLAIITFDDGWKNNLKLLPIIEKYKVYSTFFIVTDAIETGNFWWEFADKINENNIEEFNSVEHLKKVENSERKKIVDKLKKDLNIKRSALTKQELIQLSKNKYVTIGSHTENHPITINCSDNELQNEFINSKFNLEKWLNYKINYFAYPNGDFDDRDIELLKSIGYSCAFTTKSNTISTSSRTYELPRFAINSNGGFYENKAKMLGIWQRFFPK